MSSITRPSCCTPAIVTVFMYIFPPTSIDFCPDFGKCSCIKLPTSSHPLLHDMNPASNCIYTVNMMKKWSCEFVYVYVCVCACVRLGVHTIVCVHVCVHTCAWVLVARVSICGYVRSCALYMHVRACVHVTCNPAPGVSTHWAVNTSESRSPFFLLYIKGCTCIHVLTQACI